MQKSVFGESPDGETVRSIDGLIPAAEKWYLHVWVCGAYAGAYEHNTEDEAIWDMEDRVEKWLGHCGCRYMVSRRSTEPGS